MEDKKKKSVTEQEKKQESATGQEKNQVAETPYSLGVMLDEAEQELEMYILRLMNTKGIPASLMEHILNSAMLKIKDLKIKEYVREIYDKAEKAGGKNG